MKKQLNNMELIKQLIERKELNTIRKELKKELNIIEWEELTRSSRS